jgi:methionyl-tRNA synthetase
MMIVVLLYVLQEDGGTTSPRMMRLFVGVAAAVVATGAAFDIRDAFFLRRMVTQADTMLDTIDNMESLNNALRAQRHDFRNHLQVVYYLIEMEDYGEANAYIAEMEPWKLAKDDSQRERLAIVLWTALQVVSDCNVMLTPFLPFTAQKVHETLGRTGVWAAEPQI